MTLIVGAPVADRAWALPHWFECLSRQTRQPDGFVFLHSGRADDGTAQAIWDGVSDTWCCLVHDQRAPHSRHDNERFATLADLRNQMLKLAVGQMRADLFLSLDTDIMLEDPRTIERMVEMLNEGAEVASVHTAFHPLASDPEAEVDGHCWAYNAGWWRPGSSLDDSQRPWERPTPDQVPWGETLSIDIPMGVWLADRDVLERCRYRWHEGGEDLGFAQDLDRHDFECWWDTSIYAPHIWQASHLRVPA